MPTFRDDIRLGTKVPQMKTEDYEDASVTTEKIANKAITESKLAEHAVTSSILGNGAVESSNIKDGSITNEKIANRTIRAYEKLARSSISQEEMGTFSVGNDELIDGSVTTEKIEDGSITNEKISERTISKDKLVDGTISGDKITEEAISSNLIKPEAVTIEKIAAEVWSKLKDEYLRIDGSNEMMADLNMNGNHINGIESIASRTITSSHFSTFLQNYINLFDGYNGISLVLEKSGSTKSTIKCSMNEYGEWVATGFKTISQSSFGLLGNEGSVVAAMTDSDVDSCIASVFE